MGFVAWRFSQYTFHRHPKLACPDEHQGFGTQGAIIAMGPDFRQDEGGATFSSSPLMGEVPRRSGVGARRSRKTSKVTLSVRFADTFPIEGKD